MQDRYTGDIGDFVKYGLLRTLTEGRRLGVAWYLFPDQNNTGDGGHTEYLEQPDDWRGRDPELFDTLKRIVDDDRRSVAAVEKSGLLMGAKFSNEKLCVPSTCRKPAQYKMRCEWRSRWFDRVKETLRDCDVVFADPDNGLCEDGRFKPGTTKSWKRLPLREAKALAEGRTAIIYHHNTHFKGGHLKEIDCWKERLGPDTLALYWHGIGARSNRTFFVANSKPDIKKRLKQFAQKWKPQAEMI